LPWTLELKITLSIRIAVAVQIVVCETAPLKKDAEGYKRSITALSSSNESSSSDLNALSPSFFDTFAKSQPDAQAIYIY